MQGLNLRLLACEASALPLSESRAFSEADKIKSAPDRASIRGQRAYGPPKRRACPGPRPILFKNMSEHKVSLIWKRGDKPFEYQKYSRDHTWKFDGGHEMPASAAPAYLGNPNLVDPEEAFVASLSSCHMLTFLAVACKKKFVLDEYVDDAVGVMEKNSEGRLAITRVMLRQRLKFSGDKQPTPQEVEEMNHGAHEQCFIANSVKTEIKVETQS